MRAKLALIKLLGMAAVADSSDVYYVTHNEDSIGQGSAEAVFLDTQLLIRLIGIGSSPPRPTTQTSPTDVHATWVKSCSRPALLKPYPIYALIILLHRKHSSLHHTKPQHALVKVLSSSLLV